MPRCRSHKRTRDSPSKRVSDEIEFVLEDERDSLQQLGLPIAFGKRSNTEGEKQKNTISSDFDAVLKLSDGAEERSHPSPSDRPDQVWYEAYDPTTGHCYYYCEATQKSQWEVPAEGFVPMASNLAIQQSCKCHSTDLDNGTQPMPQGLRGAPLTSTLSAAGAVSPYARALETYARLHGLPHRTWTENRCNSDSMIFPDDAKARARMLRTGMMPRIPEPHNDHKRFLSDDEIMEESFALHVDGQDAEGSPHSVEMNAYQQDVWCKEGSEPSDVRPCSPLGESERAGEPDEINLYGNLEDPILDGTTTIDATCSTMRKADDRCRRRRGRKRRERWKRQQQMREGLPEELQKYWAQRYSLFSLYDEGILLDAESWYSVTPESIAKHHARRLADVCLRHCGGVGIALDAFAGAGGNSIQLALRGLHVISVEIDPRKAHMLAHNATLYGVRHKIDIVCADFLTIASSLKADAAFFSPPWGGPEYMDSSKCTQYDVNDMGGRSEFGLRRLLKIAFGAIGCKGAAVWLPRHASLEQTKEAAIELAIDMKECPNPIETKCEIERAVINDRVKGLTAYYGEAAQSKGL